MLLQVPNSITGRGHDRGDQVPHQFDSQSRRIFIALIGNMCPRRSRIHAYIFLAFQSCCASKHTIAGTELSPDENMLPAVNYFANASMMTSTDLLLLQPVTRRRDGFWFGL